MSNPNDELSAAHVIDYVMPTNVPVEKVKYITNRELLAEIHKSKLSYCSYISPAHGQHDAIVGSLDEITPEFIEATRVRKAHLLSQADKKELRAEGKKPAELKAAVISPSTIQTKSIIFRVMTSKHIPLDPLRKRKGKGENGNHTRTPFLPFKHYYIEDDGSFVECLRSHWKGSIEEGEFNMTLGRMTTRLAVMYMMLVDRYSRRSNWRGYTYLDEMKSHALLQLSQIGLQFDEYKSDNPFAFYTTTIKNCFTRVLNLEKRNQNIRDDILIMNGASPSYTRMNDFEHEKAINAHVAGGHDSVIHTISEGYEASIDMPNQVVMSEIEVEVDDDLLNEAYDDTDIGDMADDDTMDLNALDALDESDDD